MSDKATLVYKYDVPDDRVIPLDVTLKSQFERVFNADLSNVKIHVGHNADLVAREHDAYAVAIGSDIYFSNGQYSPETVAGIKLLAHELQHVVQFQNDRSVAYDEDISSLEHEAHEIEEVFEELSLHDIDGPLVEGATVAGLDQGAVAAASAAGLSKKKVDVDQAVGIDSFAQKRILPEITIVLESGKTVQLSGMEFFQLQEQLKEEIVDYFYDKKSGVTSTEWEDFVVRFFSFLRK